MNNNRISLIRLQNQIAIKWLTIRTDEAINVLDTFENKGVVNSIALFNYNSDWTCVTLTLQYSNSLFCSGYATYIKVCLKAVPFIANARGVKWHGGSKINPLLLLCS